MKKLLAILLTLSMMLAALVTLSVPVAADVADTFDANAQSPTISTAADYINFFNAAFVNGNSFEGKTITLLQDIVLNDTTAAGWYTNPDATVFDGGDAWVWFRGTFDGNGHTIKGAIVRGVYRSDASIGLFPCVIGGAVIKNLTVDGFYICSNNTSVAMEYGRAGTGGLIGHAKESVTVDNVLMKNGIVTCVANGLGALGAVVGAYDGQIDGQRLRILNTVVEDTVKVVAGSTSVVTGGLIGYVAENLNSHGTTVELSASKIQPYGSMEAEMALKPFGRFQANGDTAFSWTLKNESTEYSKVIPMTGGGADYTDTWNTEVLASKCYGNTYVDLTTYTVTWIVDGVTSTEEYPRGAVPSYKGTLEKPMTETHLYVFKQWSPALEPVTSDVTYTAIYDEYAKVAVTWIVDGKETVEYYKAGDLPNYKGETTKEQDADYIYLFKGWDKTVVAASEDVTYTAQYESKAKYEITWVIDGVETKETYLAGVKPSYKGKVEKADDDEYTYKFAGWDKEIVAADGDAVYTAQFEKTAKNPATTGDTADKGGCGSVVSVGFAMLVAMGMAGALVVRKKHD